MSSNFKKLISNTLKYLHIFFKFLWLQNSGGLVCIYKSPQKMKTIELGPRTLLQPEIVTHLEGDVNYTIVHTKSGKRKILSSTLKDVLHRLENHAEFLRISRKHAVNVKYLKSGTKDVFELTNGTRLTPSRRKYKELCYLYAFK